MDRYLCLRGFTPQEYGLMATQAWYQRNQPQVAWVLGVQDVEDTIDLLDESEALEMVEFDPSISLKVFLERHFNTSL